MSNLEEKTKYAFNDYEDKDLLVHEMIIDNFIECMSLLKLKIGQDNYKQLTELTVKIPIIEKFKNNVI